MKLSYKDSIRLWYSNSALRRFLKPYSILWDVKKSDLSAPEKVQKVYSREKWINRGKFWMFYWQ